MTNRNEIVMKAVNLIMDGFEGSEKHTIGQKDVWERYFNLLRKDKMRLKEGGLNPIDYAKDFTSSLEQLLRQSKSKSEKDIVSTILIIWRNVYLIQNETQAGKFMTVGERIDAYNRKVKELKKWSDLSPAGFPDT